jgi:ABC-type phosphate transport system auxiliary subunit
MAKGALCYDVSTRSQPASGSSFIWLTGSGTSACMADVFGQLAGQQHQWPASLASLTLALRIKSVLTRVLEQAWMIRRSIGGFGPTVQVV